MRLPLLGRRTAKIAAVPIGVEVVAVRASGRGDQSLGCGVRAVMIQLVRACQLVVLVTLVAACSGSVDGTAQPTFTMSTGSPESRASSSPSVTGSMSTSTESPGGELDRLTPPPTLLLSAGDQSFPVEPYDYCWEGVCGDWFGTKEPDSAFVETGEADLESVATASCWHKLDGRRMPDTCCRGRVGPRSMEARNASRTGDNHHPPERFGTRRNHALPPRGHHHNAGCSHPAPR